MASDPKLSFLLAAALLAGAPRAGLAQEPAMREEARRLGREGVRLENAGQWAAAQRSFREAYRMVPAPTLAVREARALVRLSRFVDAAEAYARAAGANVDPKSPPAFRAAVDQARLELAALRPRIPRVLITLETPDLVTPEVRLDGAVVPAHFLGVERSVDPGAHVVEMNAFAGRATQRFTVREGEVRDVVLRVDGTVRVQERDDVESSEGPRPAQIAGFIGIGVGATGLAVGVVTGVLALEAKSEVDDLCGGARCPRSASDELDSFRTLGTVSSVAYVAGGIVTAFGAGLVAWDALTVHPTDTTTVSAWMSPTSGGLRGTF